MKHLPGSTAFAVLLLSLCASAQIAASSSAPAVTQPAATASSVTAQVPRLVKFTGTVESFNAEEAGGGTTASNPASAPSTVVGMTFSLYSQQTGGVPLWSEVQNVQVDGAGHYTVQLGATQPEGLPVDLFSSAQAQWLGVRQEGQAEQPRIMLLSVPYALKAADAETFGGKPPSAYMSAPTNAGASTHTAATPGMTNAQKQAPVGGGGTTNYIAMWTSSSNLGSSAIYQSAGNVGIGTTTPTTPLNVSANNSNSAAIGVTQSGNSTYGISLALTGNSGTGIAVTNFGSSGNGIEAVTEATSGRAIAIWGITHSSSGFGVEGAATASTGVNYGVVGESYSNEGTGLLGKAESTTGQVYGLQGLTLSTEGIGVRGEASAASGSTTGVLGLNDSTSGTGILGQADTTTGTTYGVVGNSFSPSGIGAAGNNTSTTGSAYGVLGQTSSDAGDAVVGKAISSTGVTVGAFGQSSSTDGYGVVGLAVANSGSTYGIWGSVASADGIGIYGTGVNSSTEGGAEAARPLGVWGDTNQGTGIGMLATADDGLAMEGLNNSSGLSTAHFENDETTRIDSPIVSTHSAHYGGTCLMDVSGNLACNGSKSAVVAVDGGARQVALYAVEAPENWFEDVGSARLSHGSTLVSLEPTFAQTVNGSMEYHVFLTPKGDCNGLYVTNETASSFEVRELGGGTASIAFDYRIMARRRGYEAVRLADNTERFQALTVRKRSSRTQRASAPPSAPDVAIPIARNAVLHPAAGYPQPAQINKVKPQ